jgi:hypothetical protein
MQPLPPEYASFSHLPALSIRQPWAWLILHGGKRIENRPRRSHYRGIFMLHASLGCTRAEYKRAVWFAHECGFAGRVPLLDELPRGGVVGVARLTDCVEASTSPWFVGEFGYVLDDVRPLPFVPCNGALGFFRPKF